MSNPNISRTEYAFRIVLHYLQLKGEGEDLELGIMDLATDLLHLADEYGIDPDYLQRMSREHYRAENRATLERTP